MGNKVIVKYYTHPCPGEAVCTEKVHIPREADCWGVTEARRFAWMIYTNEFMSLHPDSLRLVSQIVKLSDGRVRCQMHANKIMKAMRACEATESRLQTEIGELLAGPE